MKNNTLHIFLKETFDLWFNAEIEIVKQKLEFARMASKIPKNRNSLMDYLNNDIEKLITDLVDRANKVNKKRFNVMDQFPRNRTVQQQQESEVSLTDQINEKINEDRENTDKILEMDIVETEPEVETPQTTA